ncbi:MAG: hypothetical protein MJA82_10440 [Clostridia bacterium]|nr:hypothetical protein [Clostridia bacterium]
MDTVFSNVNVEGLEFIEDRFSIQIKFTNSIKGCNKFIGNITCYDIATLKMEALEKIDFPCFVCDVNITKVEDKETLYLLEFQGSELEVSIMCKDIKIINN